MTIGLEFENVLAAAQAGGEWAFTVLYRDLNPPILRYLSALAPGAADDLASETWLAAARQLHSFVGDEDSFRAWIFTIARRRLIQHWRDSSRRPSTPLDPADLAGHAGAGPEDTEAAALAGVSGSEAARAIARALSRDQAEVVLLRMLGGLDVDQVAALLGKRPGTVRVLQHKALRKLAEKFSLEGLTR